MLPRPPGAGCGIENGADARGVRSTAGVVVHVDGPDPYPAATDSTVVVRSTGASWVAVERVILGR